MKIISPSQFDTNVTIVVTGDDIIQALNQSGMLNQYIPGNAKRLVRLQNDTMDFKGDDSIILSYKPTGSNT